MKANAWSWLALLVLPGCLLIQPLDEAKPNDETSGNAGAGQHSGGSGPGKGGAGNKAGSGSGAAASGGSSSVPPGGASNGGGSGGSDFSLFLGPWTLISGDVTSKCESEESARTSRIQPGEVDRFVLGTRESQTDLIFELEDTDVCNIFANVDDRFAYGTGTQACTVSQPDGSKSYFSYDYFEFAVSDDGQSAQMTWDLSGYNDATFDPCASELVGRFQRTDSSAPN